MVHAHSPSLSLPNASDHIGNGSVNAYMAGITTDLVWPSMSGVKNMDFDGKAIGNCGITRYCLYLFCLSHVEFRMFKKSTQIPAHCQTLPLGWDQVT